ncbi:ATP-dependent zinc metalloprotease FtsH [Deinococcus sp. Marseille-Q6407]|uniref:ATP-dependent zinc metalloprotease FtsH n=1 Tax=Deinococcus sp. Marseille-Q6407 TaxID=2969223 RepID=UPI0021C062DF|nr:ATP-dependent zinc metalloprotease FtsH [Deinococcus sp. Marseille-Q6407]
MNAGWLSRSWKWLVGGILVILLGLLLASPGPKEMPLSDFTDHLKNRQVETAVLTPDGDTLVLHGLLVGKEPYQTRTLPGDPQLTFNELQRRGVKVAYQPPARVSWLSALSWLLSLVLLGVLLYMLLRSRQMGSGDPAANAFGKSRASVVNIDRVGVTFADVAGCDEAKQDLQEVVDFLRQPEKYRSLGARIPHGLLLVGPPGSGKTLLAKAVAGEAGVPYFAISGSDFVEMFVGVGAARVRDLFEQARKAAPCIIFMDEIDAVGRKRGVGMQGGNDEREQTLNQLLVEMDGFRGEVAEEGQDIIILAATNRPDVLDAALLRPGRFDRQVVVDAPDAAGRERILRIHSRTKPLDPGVDLALIARRTAGMVGADLENLLNEAALLAARSGRGRILMSDIDEARDRVLMGPERRSLVIQEADRRITAYHEVGHALAAQLLPHADKAHKLTIVPRGRALGAALYTPEDRLHLSRSAMLDRLCVALAGHAAEQVAVGEVTTGAANDFQQATGLARRMVTEWGMSDVGPLALTEEGSNYLGYGPQPASYSDQTAEAIDRAVTELLNSQYQRAVDLLTEHAHLLHRLTDALLARESLSGEELAAVVQGGTLPAQEPAAAATPESGRPRLKPGLA